MEYKGDFKEQTPFWSGKKANPVASNPSTSTAPWNSSRLHFRPKCNPKFAHGELKISRHPSFELLRRIDYSTTRFHSSWLQTSRNFEFINISCRTSGECAVLRQIHLRYLRNVLPFYEWRSIDINELTALLSAVELGYVVLLSDAIDACILSIYPFKQELKISTANSGTGLLPLIVSKNFPSTTFFILDF